MAMRQRSGGVTATLPQKSASLSHEDFQPRSERKEEAAATVILVHLPGFVKERIKIIYVQSSHILRVSGERPLNDNRWSRFEQAFPVPENCDVDKIQGLFQQGILTITMPKKIIAKVRPVEEPKAIQKATSNPKPQEVQKEIPPPPPPRPTSAKTTAQKAPSPPKSVAEPTLQKVLEEIHPKATFPKTAQNAPSPPRSTAEPKPQKVQEQIPPKPTSTSEVEKQRDHEKIALPQGLGKAVTEPKKVVEDIRSTAVEESKTAQSLIPQKATIEPKAQKGEDAIPPKAASTTDTQKQMNNIDQKSIEKKDALMKEIGKAENLMERKMVKGKESVQNIAESAMAEMEKKERSTEDFIAEKGKGMKTAMESAKEKVKDLRSRSLNEEERQTLVNVGVAVLVIVALGVGVYLSYHHSSSIWNR
ncbi:inactive protein RESTRICTED TEV MOVEMENT 2-like isoform X2 [Alnus glutinosa]|uniref:inactive protein RESTRICTED TEV MOVEMENT 2-like isoform X2 n=1 Tax=Alnus glutinosa TaxID=3517 RepID=UPI002D776D54|nr:inactive protein RESTRICTED TEV MOVEMENT 2-like isoform X2 [Alnus glutinosa]